MSTATQQGCQPADMRAALDLLAAWRAERTDQVTAAAAQAESPFGLMTALLFVAAESLELVASVTGPAQAEAWLWYMRKELA